MNNAALRKSVLVVDDEPQVLRAIGDTLEDQFEVFAETSPEVAMRLLKELPELSVILSDQRMPGMSGDQFLAKAQELSGATRLMITGYADLEAVIRAVNLGHIFGYVSKPWSPDHLKLVVLKAAEHYQLLKDLQAERDLLHNLMDNTPDAIFFKDLKHRFVRLNRAHAARLGVARPEDGVGRPVRDFIPLDAAIEREEEDRQVFRSGVPLTDRVRRILVRPDQVRWSSTTKAPIKDHKGNVTGLVGITRDITERQQAEEKIRRLSRVYAVLSGINSTIVRVRDRDELFREACRIVVEDGKFNLAWIGVVDEAAARIRPVAWQGADPAYIEAMPLGLSEQVPHEYGLGGRAINEHKAMIANDMVNDPRILIRKEARQRGFGSLALLPLFVGEKAIAVLALYAAETGFFDDDEIKLLAELAGDISFALDHLEKEARLDYLAYYDALTGLANRTLFVERVNQYIQSAHHGQGKLALALADIERLKTINDSLGRQAGDALLKQFAERLVRAAEQMQVARIGANEFAVILPEVKGKTEAARVIEEIASRCFAEPFRVNDTEIWISAKSGFALFPDHGGDAETLFRNAEAALRKAKETGERYLFYTHDLTDLVAETLTLENQLRQALEKEEFVLHYQPKVELETRRIVGTEALIRWQSPALGLVPPARFIPLMEATGMIQEAGAWALRKAAQDHARWLELGLPASRVAVNVSPMQLRRRDFLATVQEAIAQGAKPPGLDLEITESLLMADIEGNIEKLKSVRDLGVSIAIDDFGTGYSSLGYLAKLPVQAVKIDHSFVIAMLNDSNAMTLVSTIISLAHSLRMTVIAEGVETEEQAKYLRLLRCDEMQGYLFSKPVPFEQMTALLAQGANGS